jgi:hypothetical protein
MESLKKATGVGLSASEHYDRAFEKVVLLGPSNYEKAVELFEAAAKKPARRATASPRTRATANAALYKFITTGDQAALETGSDCSVSGAPTQEKGKSC